MFIVCWFLLLAFIIYILATTADRYFCVTLTDMVEKMGIPPSIAGVTFLSFGNGGPDVFALMTAVMEDIVISGWVQTWVLAYSLQL